MAKRQITLELFRMKIIQSPLFDKKAESGSALIPAVVDGVMQSQKEKKSRQARWLIGNLERDGNWMRFEFGKTSIAPKGVYEGENFVDRKVDDAKHTTVCIDAKYGVVGIARNSNLASDGATALARKLSDVLLAGCGINTVDTIHIKPIYEPLELLEIVDKAFAVTTLKFESTPPNPFDTKDFPQEFEGWLSKTHGEKGAVSVRGENLNKKAIKDAVRSQNALGHPVQLRVREKDGDKTVVKKMHGIVNIASASGAAFQKICGDIRKKYFHIKGKQGDDES